MLLALSGKGIRKIFYADDDLIKDVDFSLTSVCPINNLS